ncbi:hypothetical protein [Gorillibacterium sp. CAU 1737]|uniref:hypothetical protein n=1 Tax=Gorillibacterium sp. CAU 1737 TaxID=3140362 RepID=UPI003261C482
MRRKSTKARLLVAAGSCLLLAILFIFAANRLDWFGGGTAQIEQLTSTDLSIITVDGIQLGAAIRDVDLSSYKPSDRFSAGNHKFRFDRLVLDVDDRDRISYLFGFNDEVRIRIKDESAVTIKDITRLLGDQYVDQSQDREQRLRKHVYYDRVNGRTAEFIYSADGQFVWLYLNQK